jgi:hypothetical protein
MSRRSLLPAGVLAAGALALAPSGAMAATKSVTINATPNPVVNSDPVTIYGSLAAPHHADQRITLWHKIAGQHRFTPVAHTQTDATGFYSIPRAEGVVRTNRKWFVRSVGVRSATVAERVYAEVKLDQPADSALTHRRVNFTGDVNPGAVHRGERIVLQSSVGRNGDRWRTIDGARVRARGHFVIGHRFSRPGSRTLRVLLRRDRFNIASVSSPVSLDVQQAQNRRFTISAASDPILAGHSTTLSGRLAGPGNANRTVTLLARNPTLNRLKPVATTSTGADGSYSFTVSPLYNTVYQARVGRRHSKKLYEGVHDVVNADQAPTSGASGSIVTFTGSVVPSKPGHVVYLQRLGDDGAFHTVEATRLGAGSRYVLTHRLGVPGVKKFRVLVPGGPWNLRGVSSVTTLTVS